MAEYYPDQALVLPMTIIRRTRLLPPEARGEVLVKEGQRVGAFDVVARGVSATRYLVIDLVKALGITDPETLRQLVLVGPGEVVNEGDLIVGDQEKKRYLIHAPATGSISDLMNGRLILESGLVKSEIAAGFDGVIASLRRTRGALVEATGTLVQGVWGNGQTHFSLFKLEPEQGLVSLEVDEFATEWRGAIVLTSQPLTRQILKGAFDQQVGGVVAPSMPANLREIALGLKMPVLLTEGFGDSPMSAVVYDTLAGCVGRQVAIEATLPAGWHTGRPEVISPFHSGEPLVTPAPDEPLRVGAQVRITREPYMGITGRVKNLPRTPQVINNGLRLPVAEVHLPSGRDALVPLANLELLGRG